MLPGSAVREYLGMDQRVDDEPAGLTAARKRIGTPFHPLLVFGCDIEDDVTVHEDRRHALD